MNTILDAILFAHIAGGSLAILSGWVAVAARKGGPVHRFAGTWFFVSMLVLGVTAAILEPFRAEPGSPLRGVFVCYFVATAWVAARRRDGTTGKFEMVACAIALAAAGALFWTGFTAVAPPTPVGAGPVFVLGGVCLLAGLLDLNAVLRRKLNPVQRLSRHLWRMCFAFFIATGSFFLGQQDIMPQAVRGSPLLVALAFAPFAVMAFWLVRLRLPKSLRAHPSLLAAPANQRAG